MPDPRFAKPAHSNVPNRPPRPIFTPVDLTQSERRPGGTNFDQQNDVKTALETIPKTNKWLLGVPRRKSLIECHKKIPKGAPRSPPKWPEVYHVLSNISTHCDKAWQEWMTQATSCYRLLQAATSGGPPPHTTSSTQNDLPSRHEPLDTNPPPPFVSDYRKVKSPTPTHTHVATLGVIATSVKQMKTQAQRHFDPLDGHNQPP